MWQLNKWLGWKKWVIANKISTEFYHLQHTFLHHFYTPLNTCLPLFIVTSQIGHWLVHWPIVESWLLPQFRSFLPLSLSFIRTSLLHFWLTVQPLGTHSFIMTPLILRKKISFAFSSNLLIRSIFILRDVGVIVPIFMSIRFL